MKLIVKLCALILTLLPLALMTGCVSLKVVSSDRAVVRLQASKPFTPQDDGWFVPDALWRDINNALADKIQDKK